VSAKGRRAGATRPQPRLYDRSLALRIKQDQRSCLATLNRRDTLLGMVEAVHTSLEPEQIARAVVERAASWIPVSCWAVVAVDGQEQQLSLLADNGLGPEMGSTLFGIANWILRTDQPFMSGDLRTDSRLEMSQAAAVLALPLRGREHIVGVLIGIDEAVSKEPPALGAPLEQAVKMLLGPAAFALDAALLLKRTEALSVTDDLTRLYNARYLNLALRRETRLAVRNSRPLSLLFIDLDGFKSINDSHGHLAGSRALVEAGAVIRGSARETDIVARFGGDEFALILPDTGLPGAMAVAERIRERIARHSFLAADGLNIHLTASVGVATLPEVASAADELVQAADAAMYRVKDRGKNGIQAATSGR
jgi:diguanylate cyclase (GGDEF)-like protein